MKLFVTFTTTLSLLLLQTFAYATTLEDGVNALQQKNYDTAIKALMKNKTNSEGMYWIAEFYSGQYGNQENAKEAFKWMSKAAQKGLVIAHARLGDFYANGFGVKQNLTKSFEYRKIAAENENAAAMGQVGFAYLYGKGVQMDKKTGIDWLEKAVAQNDLLSHQMLGAALLYDEIITPDLKRSEQLLTKALEEGGYSYSAYLLGRLYEDARFVDKNNDKAYQYYKTAAEKGNVTDAMLSLGLMYENGRSVAQSFSMARKYYQQAYDLGNKNAEQYLTSLNEKQATINKNAELAKQEMENRQNQLYRIGNQVCNSGGGWTEEYQGTMFNKPYFRKVPGTLQIKAYVERRENEKIQLRTSGITLTTETGRIIPLDATESSWGKLSPNSVFWSDYIAWFPCY